MAKFIEVDAQGNIMHVMHDPSATIVPLVNRVKFNDQNGNEFKTADGKSASHHGQAMMPPIGIDDATFDLLLGNNDLYTYDLVNQKVVKK